MNTPSNNAEVGEVFRITIVGIEPETSSVVINIRVRGPKTWMFAEGIHLRIGGQFVWSNSDSPNNNVPSEIQFSQLPRVFGDWIEQQEDKNG